MVKLIQYDYIMRSEVFSTNAFIQICNFSMNAALFRCFACRLAPFLAVWGGQAEREAPLCNMSRVAHCIDNGPMEKFWGILKRERYYGRRFTSKRELVQMIETYIHYYNTRRVQRNLGVLTPMEKYERCLAA